MDAAARKAVLRLCTYGLYVVTCAHRGQRNAFTANWLTQVSFEPSMLALSVERDAASLPLIRASGTFAVCVLDRGQRALAATLGRSLHRSPAKLEWLRWLDPEQPGPARGGSLPVPDATTEIFQAPGQTDNPVPVLADCLGYLRCRVATETPAGDSVLLVATVIDALLLREGQPLTMREAGFRHSG